MKASSTWCSRLTDNSGWWITNPTGSARNRRPTGASAWTSHGPRTYLLQYLIYTVALHRYLRLRLPDYDYERHFGGVFYLFLRGMDPASGPDCGVFPRPAGAGAGGDAGCIDGHRQAGPDGATPDTV